MAEDVVFVVPGREPFGKEAFAAAARGMKGLRMEGTSEIRELRVLGDWASLRSYIEVTTPPPGGAKPTRRAGYTLTILQGAGWALAPRARRQSADGAPHAGYGDRGASRAAELDYLHAPR